jgi:hypothetical protein
MTSFGLITEGPTDQIVIENILSGYFNNPDIIFRPFLPLRDETDKNRVENYGGWTRVFEYCGSSKFQEAFQFIDYIIVQIDTDTSEDIGYDIPKIADGKELTVEEIVKKVCEKLRNLIGNGFYDEYSEKIIFAISVHSLECWLLPLYYTDKKRAKYKNCLDTLNRALQKEGFTIDANNKNPEYYETISRQYLKHKTLMSKYKENLSLKIFVEEIEKREIVIES